VQIVATDGHPFYVVDVGWTTADAIQVGQKLVGAGGAVLTVVANRDWKPDGGVVVYNFQVEGDHTYFVGDIHAQGEWVWTHNACATDLPWARAGAARAAKGIDAGQTKITVASRDDASEVVWRLFSSQGYLNTTGRTGADVRTILGSKAGTYHWDDIFDAAGNVLGHSTKNPHSGMRHVQIHSFPDGDIIRIFFP
jgi:hypothetical protein